MQNVDLVIIGAGWHGLAMAKTYTEVHPEADVVIIDSAASIGGVWAAERLYPGLKTNNVIGTYEFSDFPMDQTYFGLQPGEHIPGTVVHAYLKLFADHFDLSRRMLLLHKVHSVELANTGEWLLNIQSLADESPAEACSQLLATKLVLATGLTSEPSLPNLPHKDRFQGQIIHSRDISSYAQNLKTASQIVVIGGNKSALDACYLAASQGSSVHMILRPDGGGPSWLWPTFFTPLKLSIARLSRIRFFTWFDPCVWTDEDIFGRIRNLLHQTWLGRLVVSRSWKLLGTLAQTKIKYKYHSRLQKLKPWVSPFWMGNSLGIHNYETDWFDLVRQGQIDIHVANIKSLSGYTIYLSDDTELQADILICCTGWKSVPQIQFLPESITYELGFPSNIDPQPEITQQARQHIFRNAPILRGGPDRTLPREVLSTSYSSPVVGHPWRLYRFLVPSDRKFLRLHNIAFLGFHLCINAIILAQVQALWVTAFFENKISHLKPDLLNYNSVCYQTILHSEYGRIRHPPQSGGAGEKFPDIVFDSIPYVDMLLNDLELKRKRKSNFWKEIFSRYDIKDFKSLVLEWIRSANSRTT